MFRMDGMASRLDVSHIRDAFPKNHGKSLAESIAFLPPLTDITCIITGCTSGIGLQIGRQLAESGAHVIMAVRKPKVAHELIQKWQNDWSGMRLPLDIEVMELDLLYLDSVVRFAEAWNARVGPLHVLINNAGIFSIGEPQRFSKDGYEEHMQVNHLAPALLSVLLLPSLVRGSPSRIVNVNSVMHYVGFVDTEDMNVVSERRQYTSLESLVGYSSSKLAQVMFSSVLHKQLPAEAVINVMCVSPGIVHTNVAMLYCRRAGRSADCRFGSPRVAAKLTRNHNICARSALFTATDPQVPEYCDLLKSDECLSVLSSHVIVVQQMLQEHIMYQLPTGCGRKHWTWSGFQQMLLRSF